MNAVGIDVSKGKSTVAVIQPFGVVIAAPTIIKLVVKPMTNQPWFNVLVT